MKDKLFHSLLFWVVVAIVLGFACSFFFPDWLAGPPRIGDFSRTPGDGIDGFAQELVNISARLLIRVPDNVTTNDAACATITFSTVEHMLFDNAKLQPGETILIQAAGSGIGTVAIKEAKALGCTVIATAGSAGIDTCTAPPTPRSATAASAAA